MVAPEYGVTIAPYCGVTIASDCGVMIALECGAAMPHNRVSSVGRNYACTSAISPRDGSVLITDRRAGFALMTLEHPSGTVVASLI